MSNDDYRLPDGRTTLKAHDVRHICVCCKCGGMADDREVVLEAHPKCFYEEEGRYAVLNLPDDERAKFRLCDIPLELMKEILERSDDDLSR